MRILVIEDDVNLRRCLASSLEAESFVVDTAHNGARGSYSARTNEYDAIILDLNLPDANGMKICKDLRANGNTTPILMLSISASTDNKICLINSGADDFMAKPFSFNELVARLRALIRRPRPLVSDVLTIDSLVLDSIKQKVTRNNQAVYLTRKEFSLLEYLLRHQGRVISRGTIMEHVWNADSDPFSNTIEAHILNIRRKIDAAQCRKLIYTVPGRGYKIDLVR